MSDKGFTPFKNDFMRSNKFDIFEKALLSVLLTYYNAEKIYPSHDTLADQTRMCRSKIIRTQKKLIKKGYIKVKKDPSCRSNLYSITEKGVSHVHSGVYHGNRGCVPEEHQAVYEGNTINKSIINKSIKEKKILKEKLPARNNGLPDWLDKKVWAGWVEHRNVDIKKKLTDKAVKLQLKMLEKHKDQHVQIIENSIMNGYTGLIEPKAGKNFNNNNNKKPSNYLKAEEGKYDHLG